MSDLTPSISVVIPCFRAGGLLAEAIESVLAQTERDWELVLVDNNASEETKEVISKYTHLFPEKIRSILEPDQGVCSARNKGITESKGRYIALLDDDDIMYPERLAIQKSSLAQFPNAILSFGLIDVISSDSKNVIQNKKECSYFSFFSESIKKIKDLRGLKFPDPLPSSVLFKKQEANNIGLFDIHYNPCFLEETDFYFRLSQVGDFINVGQSITRFRMPSQDFLRKKRFDILKKYRLILNQDYFFSKIIKFLKEKDLLDNPSIQKDLKRMRARWLREISFDFLAIPGGEKFARLLLLRAIRECPSDLKSLKHLIRSFGPFPARVRRYQSQQVYEEGIPPEITEDFLLGLFSGNHHCPFCESSSSSFDKSGNDPCPSKQNQSRNDPS
jgi:glycosyltransferase involved in cell wall biosynthesis